MQMGSHAAPLSVGAARIGWIVSALPALFLLADGAMKVVAPAPVVEAMDELGYPEYLTAGIGILAIVCTLVYLIPRTAVVGAVLMTGYLGGAVASNLRAEAGLFPIVFPLLLGALFWAGLYLRDERIRAVVAQVR